MKEYILTMLVATVVIGVMSGVAHGSFKRVSGAALGVILALAFLTPFLSFGELFGNDLQLPDIPDVEVENGYHKVAEKAFVEGIALAVAEEFGLDEDEIKVIVSGFEYEKMRAEAVYIELCGKAVAADTPGVRRYVSRNFIIDGGKCEVGIEIG